MTTPHDPDSTDRPLARRFSRRPLLGAALVAPMALTAAPLRRALAQDDADESAPIISTEAGEVPSFGGRRPGPIGQPPPAVTRQPGVRPVAIQISQAQVDAQIEPLQVVDGVMQDPTGPWVVAWYEDLAALDEGGNTVMAGHIDYWNVGPAVFYSIDDLAAGAEIAVIGEDGETYTYAVEWVQQYDAANAPITDIVGPTPDESLTLITCGGEFNYATGEYVQRTVVRAARVAADEAA